MSTYDIILERIEAVIAVLSTLEDDQAQQSMKLLQECLEAVRS